MLADIVLYPLRRSSTIWPICLRMPTEANGYLLNLDTFSDLQVQLAAENRRLFAARVTMIVSREVEDGLGEGDSNGDATPRGDDLFIGQRGERLR